MNSIKLFSTLFLILFNFSLKAQIPPIAFNYSAVARNTIGQPITTTTIGIQISILKNSSTGVSQYIENHFVNTDEFGLFNLVIGAGAVQSGNMGTIEWSNDNYYLKVAMDTSGGTNFLTMGITQLLSVPYALYAKSAGSLNNGASNGNFTHYIGEHFGGGVIFHLWKDAQGVEHGLIVDKTDLSTSQEWSNVYQVFIGPSAQSLWDGLSNSNAIVAQVGHTQSAASLCLNSTNSGYNDWYLPSIQEIDLLWNNYFNVSRTLSQISGATQMQQVNYWSSTEGEYDGAYILIFAINYQINYSYPLKNNTYYVRAIRAF